MTIILALAGRPLSNYGTKSRNESGWFIKTR